MSAPGPGTSRGGTGSFVSSPSPMMSLASTDVRRAPGSVASAPFDLGTSTASMRLRAASQQVPVNKNLDVNRGAHRRIQSTDETTIAELLGQDAGKGQSPNLSTRRLARSAHLPSRANSGSIAASISGLGLGLRTAQSDAGMTAGGAQSATTVGDGGDVQHFADGGVGGGAASGVSAGAGAAKDGARDAPMKPQKIYQLWSGPLGAAEASGTLCKWFDVYAGAGTRVKYAMPWYPLTADGESTTVDVDIEQPKIESDTTHSTVLDAARCLVRIRMLSPAQWNALQRWDISVNFQSPHVFALRTHAFAFSHLSSDWASNSLPEPSVSFFIPYSYALRFSATDAEFYLNVNDHNVVDVPNDLDLNSHILVHVPNFRCKVLYDYTKFQAPDSTIDWTVSFESDSELKDTCAATLLLPKTHPRRAVPVPVGSGPYGSKGGVAAMPNPVFMEFSKWHMSGSYNYFLHVGHDLRDSVKIDMRFDKPRLTAYAEGIAALQRFQQNYFGWNLIPTTSAEFRDCGERNLKSMVALRNWFEHESGKVLNIPFNGMETNVRMTCRDFVVLLPIPLYPQLNSDGVLAAPDREAVILFTREAVFEMRYRYREFNDYTCVIMPLRAVVPGNGGSANLATAGASGLGMDDPGAWPWDIDSGGVGDGGGGGAGGSAGIGVSERSSSLHAGFAVGGIGGGGGAMGFGSFPFSGPGAPGGVGGMGATVPVPGFLGGMLGVERGVSSGLIVIDGIRLQQISLLSSPPCAIGSAIPYEVSNKANVGSIHGDLEVPQLSAALDAMTTFDLSWSRLSSCDVLNGGMRSPLLSSRLPVVWTPSASSADTRLGPSGPQSRSRFRRKLSAAELRRAQQSQGQGQTAAPVSGRGGVTEADVGGTTEDAAGSVSVVSGADGSRNPGGKSSAENISGPDFATGGRAEASGDRASNGVEGFVSPASTKRSRRPSILLFGGSFTGTHAAEGADAAPAEHGDLGNQPDAAAEGAGLTSDVRLDTGPGDDEVGDGGSVYGLAAGGPETGSVSPSDADEDTNGDGVVPLVLRVDVVSARGLPSLFQGASTHANAWAQVKLGPEVFRTGIVPDKMNPEWEEGFNFQAPRSEPHPVIVTVLDGSYGRKRIIGDVYFDGSAVLRECDAVREKVEAEAASMASIASPVLCESELECVLDASRADKCYVYLESSDVGRLATVSKLTKGSRGDFAVSSMEPTKILKRGRARSTKPVTVRIRAHAASWTGAAAPLRPQVCGCVENDGSSVLPRSHVGRLVFFVTEYPVCRDRRAGAGARRRTCRRMGASRMSRGTRCTCFKALTKRSACCSHHGITRVGLLVQSWLSPATRCLLCSSRHRDQSTGPPQQTRARGRRPSTVHRSTADEPAVQPGLPGLKLPGTPSGAPPRHPNRSGALAAAAPTLIPGRGLGTGAWGHLDYSLAGGFPRS